MTKWRTDWRAEEQTNWRTNQQTNWQTDEHTNWRPDERTKYPTSSRTVRVHERTNSLNNRRTDARANTLISPSNVYLIKFQIRRQIRPSYYMDNDEFIERIFHMNVLEWALQ